MADSALKEELARIVGEQSMRLEEPLSRHTTFRIGGPAEVFVEPGGLEEVRSVVKACRAAGEPMRVMGRGSNLLVADAGLRGVVVHLGHRFSAIRVEGRDVFAWAGASLSAVGEAAASAGLAGFEFACGIPGTIGGAAIMNAGAYGGELSQVCPSLACLDAQGEIHEVPRSRAQWSYRHSMMDERGEIVLEARLRLEPGDEASIRERMADLARRRRDKQPLDLPSAGSTFKRPEGHFAGKLIQDAGLRGLRRGGAQVSEKHAGFVVNAGGATAHDVRALIADVQDAVRERFGVELQPEVRLWGFEGEG